MRPCDEPRATPDWMPQAARCEHCGSRTWGHECEPVSIPANVILGSE